MEREELRQAEFTAYYEGEFYSSMIKKKGYFHRWADDAFTSDDETYHQRVVGIIEGEDGKIYKVPPECITLLGKKSRAQILQEQTERLQQHYSIQP